MAVCDRGRSAWNAVVLAGGRPTADMAKVTGAADRAMIAWEGRPFVSCAVDALRGSGIVGQVVVVGPPSAEASHPDVLVPERDTIVENLRTGLAALEAGADRVLITASDNPLLSADAFRGLAELDAAAPGSALAYPVLRYDAFLDHFPGATHHVPVRLQDGPWIGGACVLIDPRRLSELDGAISRVLNARKSLVRMLGLLGWGFALRYALRMVNLGDLERRASVIAGVPVRFLRGCDPVLPIDIDGPADLEYLRSWRATASAAEGV